MPEVTNPAFDAASARLAEKQVALRKSDAAINTLTDLIVAAANGEAIAENGTRLTMSDVVKGAEALRQVHAILTAEVTELEQRLAGELRKAESRQLIERLKQSVAATARAS